MFTQEILLNKLWYIHTIKFYASEKEQANLEWMILSEYVKWNKCEKSIYRMLLFVRKKKNTQVFDYLGKNKYKKDLPETNK